MKLYLIAMMFVVFPIFGMTSLTAISENTR